MKSSIRTLDVAYNVFCRFEQVAEVKHYPGLVALYGLAQLADASGNPAIREKAQTLLRRYPDHVDHPRYNFESYRVGGNGRAYLVMRGMDDEGKALLRQYAPALCLAAAQVGSPQIRNLGTIGGNVAHGSPAADTLPVLAMLDAEVRLYSATEGTCRDIPVDTFITGPGQTLLRPGEYIEALRFSPPETRWRMAYEKVGRRNALAISRLSACCAARWEGQRLTGLRLALGAVFPTPRRLYAAEALLLREQPSPAAEMQAAELVTQAIVAAAGRRASASYKLAVAPELLLRTLRRTREEADQ